MTEKFDVTPLGINNEISALHDPLSLQLNKNSLPNSSVAQSIGYLPAIEYLTAQSGRITALISQVGLLGSTTDQPGIVSVVARVQDQIESFRSISSYLPKVDSQSSLSSYVDLTRQATLALSSLASSSALSMMTNSVVRDSQSWYGPSTLKTSSSLSQTYVNVSPIYKGENSISVVGTKSLTELSIQSGLLLATTFSVLAEKSLLSVTEQNFGSRLGLLEVQKLYLSQSIKDLSKSYLGLQKSFADNPASYSNINPSVSRVIPIDYYSNAKLLEAISTDEISDTIGEHDLSNEIQYENDFLLQTYLPKIHDGLYKMWKGAVEAFHSNNSDRIRHFSVSIRELYTQLLHLLAPDKALKNWTSDPALFDKGKPTRKARLLYICRDVNYGVMSGFLVKDIEATLAFIDIFQKGTHGIDPVFSSDHLNTIKNKAETSLKFLLQIHFGEKR